MNNIWAYFSNDPAALQHHRLCMNASTVAGSIGFFIGASGIEGFLNQPQEHA